jgi:hypothetical protein
MRLSTEAKMRDDFLCHSSVHVDIAKRAERRERARIIAKIERLGDGYANQHGKEREVIDDVLYEIKEHR